MLPPPPVPSQEEMQFLYQIDLSDLDAETLGVPPDFHRGGIRARFGRGGRLLFDRWSSGFSQPFDPRTFHREDAYGPNVGVSAEDAKRAKAALGGVAVTGVTTPTMQGTGGPQATDSPVQKRGPGRPPKVDKKPTGSPASNGQQGAATPAAT